MVRRINQNRTYSGIKFGICGIMFLYSKEKQISITSTGLLKVELVYDKE